MSYDILGINQKYWVSAKDVEKSLSFCTFSKKSYWEGKIFYFITNREMYMKENIFRKLETFLKYMNKTEISAQVYDNEAVEKCLNFQDKLFQLLKDEAE